MDRWRNVTAIPHDADQYDSGAAVHSKEVRRDGRVFATGRPGAIIVIEREFLFDLRFQMLHE